MRPEVIFETAGGVRYLGSNSQGILSQPGSSNRSKRLWPSFRAGKPLRLHALRWVFPVPFILAKHSIGKSGKRIKKKSQIIQVLLICSPSSVTRFAPITPLWPILPAFPALTFRTVYSVVRAIFGAFILPKSNFCGQIDHPAVGRIDL